MSSGDDDILRERARALRTEDATVVDEALNAEVFAFRLGSSRYAAPLAALGGVVALETVVALPGSPAHVAGVTRVAGRVLTVVDLGVVLLGQPSKNRAAMLVGHGSDRMALGCDEYETVLSLSADALRARPPGIGATLARYLTTVTSDGLGVLDIVRVVDDLMRQSEPAEEKLGGPVEY